MYSEQPLQMALATEGLSTKSSDEQACFTNRAAALQTRQLGLPEFRVARWTPVLAGSPQNCQPRSLLLQMDSPSYVEKQSDERKPLQYCDRPFLKTVREDESPWSIVCRR